MIKFKHIAFLVVMMLAAFVNGQELTSKALSFYKASQYDSAKFYIDQAIQSPEKTNSQTWQVRGLIYRKLETDTDIQPREIALESFIEARRLDVDGTYKQNIDQYLSNTIIRYYNDAVNMLNDNNLIESEKRYLRYKELYLQLIDATMNFNQSDIDYYNALGTGYSRKLVQTSGKEYEINFNLALGALKKVLDIDSMNYQANLNSAVIYYNRGADLIDNPDENTTIEELEKNIELSNQLFLKALPLFLRAYALTPDSPDVIEGLTGIYWALYDNENWMIFQTKLDKINLPLYLEAYNKDPKNKEVVKQLVRIYSTTLKDPVEHQKFKTILDQLGG